MFIIRAKDHLKYEVVAGDELLDGDDNVLLDQTDGSDVTDATPFYYILYYTVANIVGAAFPLLRSRKQGGNMEMEKNMENKATEMNANAETMNEMNTVRFMRRYSKADIISFIITLAGLVTAAYISNPYVKGTCIAVAAAHEEF